MGEVCWQVILPYHFDTKKKKKLSKMVNVDIHMILKKKNGLNKKKSPEHSFN